MSFLAARPRERVPGLSDGQESHLLCVNQKTQIGICNPIKLKQPKCFANSSFFYIEAWVWRSNEQCLHSMVLMKQGIVVYRFCVAARCHWWHVGQTSRCVFIVISQILMKKIILLILVMIVLRFGFILIGVRMTENASTEAIKKKQFNSILFVETWDAHYK